MDYRDWSKSRPLSEFQPGTVVVAHNLMDKGKYSYMLEKCAGDMSDYPEFTPYLTPADMFHQGVFEGHYYTDGALEFPREWYNPDTFSPSGPNVQSNYFKIKSRQSLGEWRRKGWIPQTPNDPDNRGWFQWYCRFWLGRRIPGLDAIQIKRWKQFNRHMGQVKANCVVAGADYGTYHSPGNLYCRPKQRQALLQWAYNAWV